MSQPNSSNTDRIVRHSSGLLQNLPKKPLTAQTTQFIKQQSNLSQMKQDIKQQPLVSQENKRNTMNSMINPFSIRQNNNPINRQPITINLNKSQENYRISLERQERQKKDRQRQPQSFIQQNQKNQNVHSNFSQNPPILQNNPIKNSKQNKLMRSIVQKLKSPSKNISYLYQAYEIIRQNNNQLLTKISNSTQHQRRRGGYLLRKDQFHRLEYGLMFYTIMNYQHDYPHYTSQKQSQLKNYIQKTCYSNLINIIKQQYDLDDLKAYYIFSQIHKKYKIISQISPFNIIIQKDKSLFNQSTILEQCNQFLRQDKQALLNCYIQILNVQRVVSPSHEYLCLSKNIKIIMQQKSKLILSLFITIFNLFWCRNPPQQRYNHRSYLNTLRKKLLSHTLLKPIDKMMLYNLNINQDLINKQLNEQLLQPSTKQIYDILITQNINLIQQTYKNTLYISQHWQTYIIDYINNIKHYQINDNQLNYKKIVFTYNLIKSYKNNGGHLQQQSYIKIQKYILKYSIILSTLFTSQFQLQNRYQYYLTVIINQYSHKQIKTKIDNQRSMIQKVNGYHKFNQFMFSQIEIEIVKKVIDKYIDINDLQGLENVLISYGIKSVFQYDFQESKSKTRKKHNNLQLINNNNDIALNCVQYYRNLMYNIPCLYDTIYQHCMQLLHKLKNRNQNIQKSLERFNAYVINYFTSQFPPKASQIIIQNIQQLQSLTTSHHYINFMINQWLNCITYNRQKHYFTYCNKIIIYVCMKILLLQNTQYVSTLSQCLLTFNDDFYSFKLDNKQSMIQYSTKYTQVYIYLQIVQSWLIQKKMYIDLMINLFKPMQKVMFHELTIQNRQINVIHKIFILCQYIRKEQYGSNRIPNKRKSKDNNQNNIDNIDRNEVYYFDKVYQRIKQLIMLSNYVSQQNINMFIIIINILEFTLKRSDVFNKIIVKSIFSLYGCIKNKGNNISTTIVNKLLKISIQISINIQKQDNQYLQNFFQPQKRQTKIQIDMIKLVHFLLLQKYKKDRPSQQTYSSIIQLLSRSTILFQLNHHLYWLKMTLLPSSQLLNHINLDQHDHCYYTLYILTQIKKNQRSDDQSINIITIIDIMVEKILQYQWDSIIYKEESKLEQKQKKSKKVIKYKLIKRQDLQLSYLLRKILQQTCILYLNLIKNLTQKTIPLQYLNKINDMLLSNLQKNSKTLKHIQQFYTIIQSQLKYYNQQYPKDKQHQKCIQLQSQMTQYQWQQRLNESIWSLVPNQRQLKKLQLQVYISNIKYTRQLINLKAQYQIRHLRTTNSILNLNIIKDKKYFQYYISILKLTNMIIHKTSSYNYHQYMKIFPYVYQPIVILKQINMTSLQKIISLRQTIEIWLYLIRSSKTTALQLYKTDHIPQNINYIINQSMQSLAKWQKISQDQLKINNVFNIQIDFLWKYMSKKDNFNICNFIQYYHKIMLIRSIINLIKQFNTLMKIETKIKNKMKDQIIQFMQLSKIKKKQIQKIWPIKNNNKDGYFYSCVEEMEKERMNQGIWEIVYGLEGALGEFSQEETIKIKGFQKQMYISL